MLTFSDNQDISLSLNFKDFFGESISPQNIDWEARIWVYPAVSVILNKKGDQIKSSGIISASCNLTEQMVVINVDSAKQGFGRGSLKVQVTASIPNSSFPDGVQTIKSDVIKTNIRIL